jgi:hypothetical protein
LYEGDEQIRMSDAWVGLGKARQVFEDKIGEGVSKWKGGILGRRNGGAVIEKWRGQVSASKGEGGKGRE